MIYSKQRASCATTHEKRDSLSNYKESFERGSYAQNSHIDGERMQGFALRNSNLRNSDDEPEIKSVFSTDKSSDYAVLPRKYKSSRYGEEKESKDKNTYNFGYEEPVYVNKRASRAKKNSSKESKQEIGVKDLKIKFDFCNDNEDSEDDTYNIPNKYNYSKIFEKFDIIFNRPDWSRFKS